MKNTKIPDNYRSALNLHDTQVGIKTVKDFFQGMLAERLNLLRVSAPLFVDPSSGLNDNLNGVERPVAFDILEQNGRIGEVVQSLAKWKRFALKKYGFQVGEGLYTDMSAIRRDEVTDNIHSIYVDQWDWEKIIRREDRNLETLQSVVKDVYRVLRKTEKYMAIRYDYIEEILPHEGHQIPAWYCDDCGQTSVSRTDLTECPHCHSKHIHQDEDVLDIALELSSMGIRVDAKALSEQLEKAGCPERAGLPFQKAVLNNELPFTIGGGIGQSRLCMFFLRKAHIGEVQSSIWPVETEEALLKYGIQLL